MNRLVLVRVGDPDGLWSRCRGKWASSESHEQVIRNMFMEGYTVYAIFVGTGDKPLLASRITNVRERGIEDEDLLPPSNDHGLLRTVVTFDVNSSVELRNILTDGDQDVLDYVKYKRGSQILIPSEVSESFLRSISSVNMYFRGNYTYFNPNSYLNPNYGLNFNVNGY
jgi:hypothetical protein